MKTSKLPAYYIGTHANLDLGEDDTVARTAHRLVGYCLGDADAPAHSRETTLGLEGGEAAEGRAERLDWGGHVSETVVSLHVSVRLTYMDRTSDTTWMVVLQDRLGRVFLTPFADGSEFSEAFVERPIKSIRIETITGEHYRAAVRQMAEQGFVCFGSDTRIRTPEGDKKVVRLRPGDLVETLDHGPQPIRWVAMRRLGPLELRANPAIRPIRVARGALGGGLPARDVLLSPQHRVLVRSRLAMQMFGTTEVLVAVRALVGLPGIEVAEDVGGVIYVHLLFDAHEVILADGAPMESLFLGAGARDAVGQVALTEIETILPEVVEIMREGRGEPVRPFTDTERAAEMGRAHRSRRVPFVQGF
ncbi:Hint domain-containing protein [Maritimibacter sp. DP1N21-5]|uniref:Hint domain-containing protein n=1 Tax=Maritimibacter sp. DP1N21-5 TaxID=2836867 RepID=UPI001C463E4A|nr:Hint domain-containing protein [Maritimibacter sp. DP1N21-5]MBV7409184.1 Hint domain-containing protein [Maritimibacter sp. DP1N21-5]